MTDDLWPAVAIVGLFVMVLMIRKLFGKGRRGGSTDGGSGGFWDSGDSGGDGGGD